MMKTFTSHWFSGVWTMTVMGLSIMLSIYTEDSSYVARAVPWSKVQPVRHSLIVIYSSKKKLSIWAYGDLVLDVLTGW